MLDFHWPASLLLLPLPWLMRWLLPPAANRSAALQVSFLERLQRLDNASALIEAKPQRWPLLLIWLLLILAAMRPQWLGEPLSVNVSGRDMMLAVDLSGSMEYRDMQLDGQETDRLSLVKHLLGEFIERRHGDRLGLILFGSKAYVQAPLTLDRNSIKVWLEESFIGLAGRETAIGDAIGLAIKRLSDEPAESRVLVLITDGANTAGRISPIQAARLAANQQIRIFTIGVGSDNMSENSLGNLLGMDIDPSIDLDEGTLKEIALLTSGAYFRARDSDSLEAIYRELDRLEPALRDGRPQRAAKPLYQWPLALALILSIVLAGHALRGGRGHD